jgi:1-acyl-sn-glycerol-3-phosphate acyltransferase
MSPIYWLGHRFFREISRGFFNLHVLGGENLRVPGPALIVSNHASFLDPPFIGAAFDEPISFLARKTLFDHPVAGWLLRQWHAVPVDRDGGDATSLKTVIRVLKSGKKVLIFPEGTRTPDGSLQKAEAGTGLVIAKSNSPVLPIRIFGAYEALPRDRKLPRPATITLAAGKPYRVDLAARSETGKALYQKLADEAMERIAVLQV